ncbi:MULTISPECIES: hypothetical protein [unclassified Brenneria]|uniref:hypothetical protein n=1 Tax=unclassified Brenneria TaxID=2634434 RepID=UPI0029C5C2F3|nr:MULTISPECIES: hypothetical protein [unclassified Brenneria]MDX5627830.1 hypothetical protein [Brenneria sp. L3-3Z]MDX5695079.1 hypothetical protein [Brenneria sp. L4-2C]
MTQKSTRHPRGNRQGSPAETVDSHYLIPACVGMTQKSTRHPRGSRRGSPAETVDSHYLIPACVGMTNKSIPPSPSAAGGSA